MNGMGTWLILVASVDRPVVAAVLVVADLPQSPEDDLSSG